MVVAKEETRGWSYIVYGDGGTTIVPILEWYISHRRWQQKRCHTTRKSWSKFVTLSKWWWRRCRQLKGRKGLTPISYMMVCLCGKCVLPTLWPLSRAMVIFFFQSWKIIARRAVSVLYVHGLSTVVWFVWKITKPSDPAQSGDKKVYLLGEVCRAFIRYSPFFTFVSIFFFCFFRSYSCNIFMKFGTFIYVCVRLRICEKRAFRCDIFIV